MTINKITQQSYNPYQSNPNIFGLQNMGVGSNKGYDVPALKGQQLSPTIAKPLGNAVEWLGDKLGLKEGNLSEAIAGGYTQHTDPFKLVKPAQAAENSGGNTTLSADVLRNKFGFNDQSVIDSILNSQTDRERYERELNGGGTVPDKTVSKTGNPRAGEILSDPVYKNDFEQSGLDMDNYLERLALVEQEYGKSSDLLNQREADIRAEQPGIEKGITDQASMLREKALMGREDAQSAARRLYSELQQGYRQRFGGASSAGEAAMALTGNEQQRQMAQNNRTYQESIAQVDLSANEAIRAAQSEFTSRLDAIRQNRTQLEADKLVARRQALQDLSAKVFQIQQQREIFKQNIALMQEQARIQNETNLKNLSTNPASNLTFNNQPTTASGNQGINTAIGYMGTGLAKTENPIGVGVYPIATMIDGRTKYSDGSIR